MRGFEKGTDVTSELDAIRGAFAKAAAAIWATYDPDEAWRQSAELGNLVRELESDSATLRAKVAAEMKRTGGLTLTDLAARLGVSLTRAAQLAKAGKQEGQIMTEASDSPEQPAVALAIIATDRGVLVEDRADKIPPVSFPGGDVNPGESAAAAAIRRTLAETGITITVTGELGRRVHPKTARTIIYLSAAAEGSLDAQLLDTEDLTAVRWVSAEETRALMPDLYGPVREYLDNLG